MKKLLGELDDYVDLKGKQYKEAGVYPSKQDADIDPRAYKIEKHLFFMYKQLYAIDEIWLFNKVDRLKVYIG